MAALAAFVLIAGHAWLLRPALPPPTLSDFSQLTHDATAKNLIGTDGSRLHFGKDFGGVWQMSVHGGSEAPASFSLPGNSIFQLSSVSPDGAKLLIAQLSGLSNASVPLWSVPILGGSPHRLADIRGISGAWSPDGQKLVYVSDYALYLAEADGTEPRQLTTLPGALAGPNADTSEGQNITTSPSWSPDGRMIAMTLVTSKAQGNQLWEVCGREEPARNVSRMVSRQRGMLRLMEPGWDIFHLSLTGANLGGTPDRQLLHKVSREPVQLTSGLVSYGSPIFAKEGKSVFAVESIRRGELQRFNFATKHFDPFLKSISAQDTAFSKDGQWVAYVSHLDGVLWRSKLDGSQKLQLSSPPVYALLPRWSPNGTEISVFRPGKGPPRAHL